MAKRMNTTTMTTTSTRTKVAEEGATQALMALASAATHAQQCKLHEVQVLLALATENRAALPVQQHVVTASPVPVRNFWSAATTSSRAPAGPARALASPPPLSASSAGPSTKRRAENTPSGTSSTGKKACRWKSTVLLNEQYVHATAAPLSPTAAPASAPATAAPSKKAVRCKWQTTQQIVPGKSERAPASPRSVLSAPASPARSDCELA